MTNDATNDLRFYDNDRPPLVAGDYRITVRQEVVLPPPDLSPPDYVYAQPFQVSGPHFELGPDDVVSVYPPPGSVADQHVTLPHVVLGRPTLPWEIPLDPTGEASAVREDTFNASTPDPLVAPWLAILLLRPEEIVHPADDTSNLTGTRVVPLGDYLTPGSDLAGPGFSPDHIDRFEREYPKQQCTVVDVRRAVFDAIAPRRDELPFLAHAREVDTADQEVAAAAGWFSVVVGNRFPTASPAGVYVAHLVSLEGFGDILTNDGAAPKAAAVRLLSLHSWMFRSFTSSHNFDALVKGLDIDTLRLPAPSRTGDRTEAAAAAATLVQQALDGGYTAAPYLTRLGEATTAWYRGPCLPVQMVHNPQPAYPAAEAALVYDPATGMFDVSFAVAWQVGRLLALANREFAVALLGWLRSLGKASHLLADRLALFERYDTLERPDEIAELLAPGTVRRVLARHLARTLAPTIVGDETRPSALGPPRDPSDLIDDGSRVTGVIDVSELAALQDGTGPLGVSRPGGIEAAVVDLVRSRRPPLPEATLRTRPPRPVPADPPGQAQQAAVPEPKAGAVWTPRPHRTRALMAVPAGAGAVLDQGPPLPESAARWLGQLRLLEGVPFNHLVADARMLPEESMRFFFIDENWLDALVDGALSIGAVADHEAATAAAAGHHLRDMARRHAAVERTRQQQQRHSLSARSAGPLGQAPGSVAAPATDTLAPVWTGFVLRSAIVSGWPGLKVTGAADSHGKASLTPLRVERPAPDVLVAIFDGVVNRVALAMPAQTLHFGAFDDDGTPSLRPRGLGEGIPVGEKTEVPDLPVPRRDDNGGDAWVVDVRSLRKGLESRLAAAYKPGAAPPVAPGAFGVELVVAAERQAFVQMATAPPMPAQTSEPSMTTAPPPAAPTDVARLMAELEAFDHGR